MIETTTTTGATIGTVRRPRALALGYLLIAALVAGCVSSKGKTSHGSSPPVGTDVARGVNSGAATEITTAYLHFFDPTLAQSERITFIQDGAEFSQAITVQSKSEFAKAVSVQVTKVNVTSANKATVIFTLLLDGKPELPNQTGYAVHEDGTWKVAGATFCGVLAAQGAPPQVCRMPAATTLPS